MATTTAYMVEAGEYEDRRVLVISLDQAAAQRYADHHNIQHDLALLCGAAEVTEVECIPADWAPTVIEVEPEFCDNCHATTALECYCAEPMGALGDYFPGGHAPAAYARQAAYYLHQGDLRSAFRYAYLPADPSPTRRCTGCLGADTGARCCICGGLR